MSVGLCENRVRCGLWREGGRIGKGEKEGAARDAAGASTAAASFFLWVGWWGYLLRARVARGDELLGDQVDQLEGRVPQPADLALAHLVEGAVGGEQANPDA